MQEMGLDPQYLLQPDHPPRRVVSLVPSLTESLFELGLGEVVGVTDYCLHPAAALAGMPRLGGTKNPRLDNILALKPDLVLANQEENSRSSIEALRAAGIPVWLSFPRTVQQSLDDLWYLAGLFQSPAAAGKLKTLAMAVDWARSAAADLPGVRYFCPIWYEGNGVDTGWWMTFNQQTYSHDLLALCGGVNVFAHRLRRYPLAADLGDAQVEPAGDRDTRYPRLSAAEIEEANPDVIILPSEPYAFTEKFRLHIMTLWPELKAVRGNRVVLVDGSLITWHGTRLARALRDLPAIINSD